MQSLSFIQSRKPLELLYKTEVTLTQNTGMRSHQSRAMSRAMGFDQNERQGFPLGVSLLRDSGWESLPPHVSIVQL